MDRTEFAFSTSIPKRLPNVDPDTIHKDGFKIHDGILKNAATRFNLATESPDEFEDEYSN